MRHGIYMHPHDLRALEGEGGLERVARLGFHDVSMAVSDHGGRMLLPWHPTSAVRNFEAGVVHFVPGGDYGRLRPTVSAEVRGAARSPLEQFVHSARRAELSPWAWVRPLRNPAIARQFPSTGVRNAFGDRDPTVLCPAQPDVQDYVINLVDDLAVTPGLTGIELEGLGFADFRRGGLRVTECVPADRYVDFLLATCFCDDCRDAMARTGLSPDKLATRVRELVRARLATVDVLVARPRKQAHDEVFRELEDDLGNAGMFTIWSHRLAVYMRLLTRIRAAVRGRCRVALHVQFHSVAAGDALGAPLQVVQNHADELVVGHGDDGAEAIRAAWRDQPATKVALHAAIAPRPPGFRSADDMWAVREAVRDGGGIGLKIQHLAALPWPTLERIAAVLREGERSRAVWA